MERSKAFFNNAKLNVYDGVDLHTNLDEKTFGLLQQGCATVMDVAGQRELTSDEDLEKRIEETVFRLRKLFDSPGYQIDISLTRDPDRGEETVANALSDARQSAKSMGVDAEHIFKDTIRKLGGVVAFEKGLMVFKTSIYALRPEEVESLRAKAAKEPFIKARYGAATQFVGGETLLNNHRTMLRMLMQELNRYWVVRELTVKDALRRIRQEISPEMTPDSWMPVTWGDDLPFGKFVADEDDISQLTPASFGVQLFPQKPFLSENPSIFRLGKRHIAPLNFYMLPQYPRRFSTLFENLDPKLPFRLNISIETGGAQLRRKMTGRKRMAQALSLMNQRNKDIATSATYIIGRLKEKMPLVIIRANVATWGDSLEQVEQRKTQIVNEFSAWGAPELRDNMEFPFATWMESIPGITRTPASLPAPYFADEALKLLPMDRPSALWEKGSFLLRSEDGKLLPAKLFSKDQSTWNGLSLALPGSGKTVFLLARLFAALFGAGSAGLPFQTLLDIGFSSEGYIDLVKSILPEDKQDLAILNRMELSKREIINPFDTPLGCDIPTPEDAQYVQGLLESIVTPADGKVDSVLLDAAAMLARQAYVYKNEKPSVFTPGIIPEIDRALEEIRAELPENSPQWREVRDVLFDAGKVRLAGIAHRHAVPNFTELSSIVSEDPQLASQYGGRTDAKGANILEELRRLVIEALGAYPNLAGVSTFDFGRARIVAFNLRAVAGDGSAKMVKQTRIMYALAKKAGTRGYFIDSDSLHNIPPRYFRYHKDRVAELKNTPKWLIYEEFHVPAKAKNAEGNSQTVSETDNEMRTGRKYTVGVDAVSQRLPDFTDDMITNSTSTFIFDASDDEMLSNMAKRFRFSQPVVQRMRRFLTGPTSEGAPVLARWKVKKLGVTLQDALLTLGPISLWAFCSTEEDVIVRRITAARLGMKEATQKLASVFPAGSLGSAHDEVMQQLSRFEPHFAQRAKRYGKEILVEAMLTLPKEEFLGICSGRLALSKDIAARVLDREDVA